MDQTIYSIITQVLENKDSLVLITCFISALVSLALDLIAIYNERRMGLLICVAVLSIMGFFEAMYEISVSSTGLEGVLKKILFGFSVVPMLLSIYLIFSHKNQDNNGVRDEERGSEAAITTAASSNSNEVHGFCSA